MGWLYRPVTWLAQVLCRMGMALHRLVPNQNASKERK